MPGTYRIFLTLVASSVLLVQICTGQSTRRLIKEADGYFAHHMYREALQYYKQGGNAETWDKDTRLKVAICRYEVNDLSDATSLLNTLIEEGKTDPMVYFYLARTLQNRELYRQAIRTYKQFLRRSKDNDPHREWVKDEILRCANGNSLKYSDQNAYVENLGTAINTFHDEFAPVPSPNYTERLYFSSARREPAYQTGDQSGKYLRHQANMYFSEHHNGMWRSAEGLDPDLNTPHYDEIICDFSPDGQHLFFLKQAKPGMAQLLIDTFALSERKLKVASSLGPFDPAAGDRDLQVYNDTMILFSSPRAGGFGGFDLYYAIRRGGAWRDAVNLGPVINSFYDEISPFLTRNGRSLYFSSNSRGSIGGFDIFSASFDDTTAMWSKPHNAGPPVNSPGDDMHFKLAADAMSAFFASDRKTGYGKRDIYAAYMKETVRPHLVLSVPLTFAQVAPGAAITDNVKAARQPQKVKEYFIGDLIYEPNDLVLTPQNIKKLDVIANLLLIYPEIKASLTCHDAPSGNRSFDLYFSVKKAEQAAEYLVKKGVSYDRLYIKGCGSLYPRAQAPDPLTPNAAVDRLNRRIEVNIHDADDQPVSLIYEHPNIPENLWDPRWRKYADKRSGLVYRVQIAVVSQLLQHNVLDRHDDALIFVDPDSRNYRYYLGLEPNFREAANLRDTLRAEGFDDAFVVPQINGINIPREKILDHAAEYPDLLNLLEERK